MTSISTAVIKKLDSYEKPDTKEIQAYAEEKSEQLIEALRLNEIEAELEEICFSANRIAFVLHLLTSVTSAKLNRLKPLLALQISIQYLDIDTLPGEDLTIAVSIINPVRGVFSMRQAVESYDIENDDDPLMYFLGEDILCYTNVASLKDTSPLLIGGSTGSGKSLFIHSLICTLMLHASWDDVKLVLIDTNKVEFAPYKDIPYLISPIINNADDAIKAMECISEIIEERVNILSSAGKRNIEAYNETLKSGKDQRGEQGTSDLKIIPYVIVVIDGVQDILLQHRSEVESLYLNIIAKAKIAGVYIVMSTQMPSSAVLSKSIISKCTARIAFAMASQKDSIAILEEYGAEELAGNGELLFRSFKTKDFVKLQGVYVSDREIGDIAEYVRKKGRPKYHDSFAAKFLYTPKTYNYVSASADPMLEEIEDYVIEAQRASTTLLQRRFGIGYNRAARIIDELEERGIIGPAQGSIPREVYKKRKYNHSAVSGSAEEGIGISAKTDTPSPYVEYKSEGTDSIQSDLDYSMTLKLVGVEDADSDDQTHKKQKLTDRRTADKSRNGNEKTKAVTKPTDWLVMLTFFFLSLLYATGITASIWALVSFVFGIFGFVLSAPFLRGRVMEVVKDDNLRFALIVLCYFIVLVATVNEVHR